MTTTQPAADPAVVEWMRNHRRTNPTWPKLRTLSAYLTDHNPDAFTGDEPWMRAPGVPALKAAADIAYADPLTVDDIPAGEGPRSLYLQHHGAFTYLWCKEDGGDLRQLLRRPRCPEPHEDALWEHLAATLPTIEATP